MINTANRFTLLRQRQRNAYWHDLDWPPENFWHTRLQNSFRKDDMSWLQNNSNWKFWVLSIKYIILCICGWFFLGDWKFKLFLKVLSCRYSCFLNISMILPNLFQNVNTIFMHMISSHETNTLIKLKLF